MLTRQILKNLAIPVIGRESIDSWTTDFLDRNKDTLTTAWTTPMMKNRQKADFSKKYQL